MYNAYITTRTHKQPNHPGNTTSAPTASDCFLVEHGEHQGTKERAKAPSGHIAVLYQGEKRGNDDDDEKDDDDKTHTHTHTHTHTKLPIMLSTGRNNHHTNQALVQNT